MVLCAQTFACLLDGLFGANTLSLAWFSCVFAHEVCSKLPLSFFKVSAGQMKGPCVGNAARVSSQSLPIDSPILKQLRPNPLPSLPWHGCSWAWAMCLDCLVKMLACLFRGLFGANTSLSLAWFSCVFARVVCSGHGSVLPRQVRLPSSGNYKVRAIWSRFVSTDSLLVLAMCLTRRTSHGHS